MKDTRKKDRRAKKVKVKNERRKGPRRLTCECGGKIEVICFKQSPDKFVCFRCGKTY